MVRMIIFSFCLIFSFQVGNAASMSLEQTIQKVVQGFYRQDATVLNKLIHKNTGVYIMYRRGVPNTYDHIDQFDFNRPVPEYLPYEPVSPQLLQLSRKVTRYEQVPKFNCNMERWERYGLSVGRLGADNLLSKTALFFQQHEPAFAVSDQEIKEYKELESKSRRIVLVSKNGNELVFHLTNIKSKWYLTLLDRVSSDCSA